MANAWRASVFPPNWFDPHAWDAGKPPESTEDYMARKMEEVEMVMPIYDKVSPLRDTKADCDSPSFELWLWALHWMEVDEHFEYRLSTVQDAGHEEFLHVINPRVHLPPRNEEEHARYEDAALRFIRSFDVEERTRGWLQHMQNQVEQVVRDCAVPRTSRRVELIYL